MEKMIYNSKDNFRKAFTWKNKKEATDLRFSNSESIDRIIGGGSILLTN
jgi:hypothetical protein